MPTARFSGWRPARGSHFQTRPHKLREAMAREHQGRTLNGIVESTGPISAAIPSRKTGPRTARIAASKRTSPASANASSSCASATAAALPSLPAAKAMPSRSFAGASVRWRRSTRTGARDGISFTPDGIRAASTTPSRSWTRAFAPTKPRAIFSRLRRAEVGTHHHIAGPYLNAYATEMSWREDNRVFPTGIKRRWSRVRRWRRRPRAIGPDTGNGRRSRAPLPILWRGRGGALQSLRGPGGSDLAWISPEIPA